MKYGLTKEQISSLSEEQKDNLIFSILHANEELTTRINDLEEILRLKSTKPFILSFRTFLTLNRVDLVS